jgi:hypothetical protein
MAPAVGTSCRGVELVRSPLWKRDRRPDVALFRVFAGDREFNPLAIVVPSEGRRARVVRFWRAFRDYKHGKDRLLRAAEAELEGYLTEGA